MIVKNESHIISETLNSIKKYIDYWVISDTGSTDGTQKLIKDFFSREGIPGKLVQHKWIDFGANRTLALQAASKYIPNKNKYYIWVIDADDLVQGDLDLSALCTRKDVYSLKYGNTFTYDRQQIFKAKYNWEYVGVLHEFPKCSNKKNPSKEVIKGDYFIDSRRLGNRNMDPEKYKKDAVTLEKALQKEPNNIRYMFYLAQSYKDAGILDKAIYWYKKRASKGGWKEEVYYSYYKIASLMQRKGESWERVMEAYMRAYKYLPERAEPLYQIAKYYQENNMFTKGYKYAKQAHKIPYPEKLKLFLDRDVYNYKISDVLSICAYYVGKYQESFDVCKEVLKSTLIPEYQITRIKENMRYSLNKLYSSDTKNKENLAFYVGYSLFTDDHVYGSELALVSIAKELLKNSYNIYIFGDNIKTNVKDGLTFMSSDDFRLFQQKNIIHILIISRYINYFIEFEHTALQTYLWLHDSEYQWAWKGQVLPAKGKYLIANVLDKIDKIVTLTPWHKDIIIAKYNLPKDKVCIIGNGLNDKYFQHKNIEKIKGRFIYTSNPSRGLDIVLDYFEEIYKEFPYVTLDVYRGKAEFNDKTKHLLSRMKSMSNTRFHGKISQKELSVKFYETDIFLYPTTFSETFCMSALEAMRAGCYCITSDVAALPYTVGFKGVCISGDPYLKTTKLKYLKEVRKALTNDKHKREIQKKAAEEAKKETWRGKSQEWINLFKDEMTEIMSDDWLLIPDKDMFGFDLEKISNKSIAELSENAKPHCIAFNSSGYMKYYTEQENLMDLPGNDLYVRKDTKVGLLDVKETNQDILLSFYVINLESRIDRKERIIKRLEDHGCKYKIVKALTIESDELNYYIKGSEELNNYNPGSILASRNRLAEFACFASHLKAIKEFLKSQKKYGVIIEDDAMFRQGFKKTLISLVEKLDNVPLISLCVTNTKPFEDIKKYLDQKPRILPINPDSSWGAVGYIINKEYAEKCLDLYDRPFSEIDKEYYIKGLDKRVVSEMIIMNSLGYCIYPLLLIEECNKSNIGETNPEFHRKIFNFFEPNRYS